MVFHLCTRLILWTKLAPLKEEYGGSDLTQGCLAKSSKSGTGGKVAKFMVAITHGKGVLVCERYDKMDGNYFASSIDQHFNAMFERSCKGLSQLWLWPVQLWLVAIVTF